MDRARLKAEGVAFGRCLQTAYKTVVMYSMDHPAVERAVQPAFDGLQALLPHMPHLVFGFMNRRLLLNDFLTDEPTLQLLAAEFARRGIAAVTFLAGITPAEFKQTLTILAAKPKVIEEQGGLKAFLEAHPMPRVRVLPARTAEDGDTILGMDTETFLVAGESPPSADSRSGSALDVLLRCAHMEQAFSAPPSGADLIRVASQAAETAFLDPTTDPREIAAALSRALQEVTPERFLAALPAVKQAELRGRPPDEIAAEVMEDATAGWVVKRLAAGPAEAVAGLGEEDALRVMMVGMNMTRTVDRLLQKLARMLEEANLPPALFERIRQGIAWNSLSSREKQQRLLETARYDDLQFRQLIEYVKECLQARKIDEATQVAAHYFRFLDAPTADVQAELPRAPELLRVLADPATLPCVCRVVERLGQELLDDRHAVGECHALLAAVLTDAVALLGGQPDLEALHRLGTALERSLARDRGRHADCCGAALTRLLPAGSAGRLIDLYLEKRNDAERAKMAADLLAWLGQAGAEEVFGRLVDETAAPNRVRLLRLLTQLGPAGIRAARARLADERWYVVRNACYVLGDLGDPDLPEVLGGALQHADARVQQAAVAAMVRCQAPRVAAALAQALPALGADVVERALEELSFRKDPAAIDGLEGFVRLGTGAKPSALEKAVQALAAIPAQRAVEVLGAVLLEPGHPLLVRRAAAAALTRGPQPAARRFLEELVRRAPADPLAAGVQRALGRSGPR